MSAGVKENPSLKQNFRRRVQEPAYDLQNFVRLFVRVASGLENQRVRGFEREVSGLCLVFRLRNECFSGIEEAAAPEGLV
jgi:hypothetical protein